MIDIHNHLIPNIDDGSDSLELSRNLLKEAIEEGITDVLVTPHYMPKGEYRVKRNELLKLFNEFRSACADLKINLYLGNELFIDSGLDELIENNEVCSMNDSQYVLVEFPFERYKADYDEYLYNISLSHKIIIAHPERYQYVKDDHGFVKRWLSNGYYLQANQTFRFSKTEKKVVFDLIEKGRLHFIASDAHSEYRPLHLKSCYELIERKFSRETAELLMDVNPLRVIENKAVKKVPPVKKRLF